MARATRMRGMNISCREHRKFPGALNRRRADNPVSAQRAGLSVVGTTSGSMGSEYFPPQDAPLHNSAGGGTNFAAPESRKPRGLNPAQPVPLDRGLGRGHRGHAWHSSAARRQRRGAGLPADSLAAANSSAQARQSRSQGADLQRKGDEVSAPSITRWQSRMLDSQSSASFWHGTARDGRDPSATTRKRRSSAASGNAIGVGEGSMEKISNPRSGVSAEGFSGGHCGNS